MIIEYSMGYNRAEAVMMCGEFRDLKHFTMFESVEKTYGRNIYSYKILKS